jgi:hypothetical protein
MCVRTDYSFVSILHLFVKYHKCLSLDWSKGPRSEFFGLLFWTTKVGERMESIFLIRILLCLYCAVALIHFFGVGWCYICVMYPGVRRSVLRLFFRPTGFSFEFQQWGADSQSDPVVIMSTFASGTLLSYGGFKHDLSDPIPATNQILPPLQFR